MLGSYNKTGHILPDSIEPMIGWRLWDTTKSYGEDFLISPQQKTLWAPGQKCIALCRHEGKARLVCHCGFNAFLTRETLEKKQTHMHMSGIGRGILGQVALWGEVHEYADGYRGQYAYPHKLFATSEKEKELVKSLAERYEIPWEMADPIKPVSPLVSPLEPFKQLANALRTAYAMNVETRKDQEPRRGAIIHKDIRDFALLWTRAWISEKKAPLITWYQQTLVHTLEFVTQDGTLHQTRGFTPADLQKVLTTIKGTQATPASDETKSQGPPAA